MHHLLIIFASFLLGIVSGFLNGSTTGGGLVSIPGMIFLGLSPSAAIATTRLSAFSGGLTSLLKYRQAGMIQWKRVVPFLILALVGGISGSRLLLQINGQDLEKIIAILLLLLAPVLVLSKDFGIKDVAKSKNRNRAGYLVVFAVLIYAAMFGGGGGVFLIYSLVYFFGMSIIQANANGSVMGLVATTTALLYYLHSGIVNFDLGLPLMAGGAIGGYLGARTAIEKGNKVVRVAFLVIVVASAFKLLFF